jgi:hypothetical protein
LFKCVKSLVKIIVPSETFRIIGTTYDKMDSLGDKNADTTFVDVVLTEHVKDLGHIMGISVSSHSPSQIHRMREEEMRER